VVVQHTGDFDDRRVAPVVAVGVVDGLESVDDDEQRRDDLAAAGGRAMRALCLGRRLAG